MDCFCSLSEWSLFLPRNSHDRNLMNFVGGKRQAEEKTNLSYFIMITFHFDFGMPIISLSGGRFSSFSAQIDEKDRKDCPKYCVYGDFFL